MRIHNDYLSDNVKQLFTDTMLSDKPVFIARIGGVEFNLACKYYTDKVCTLQNYVKHINQLGSYAGYFDCTENKQQNLATYLDLTIESYKNAKVITFGNGELMKSINRGDVYSEWSELLNYVSKDKDIINYTFIEHIPNFLDSFKVWAEGKKILIVSPLSRSIEHQYPKRNTLFKSGYQFPNFELVTYNTRLTYSKFYDTKETLRLDTNNWHEELERMKLGISKLDFDIALLSCASYSGPLGNYITETLNKKAIYFGGTINVMWNIYGGRYNNGFVNAIVNLDTQIDPLENDSIYSSSAGFHTDNESLYAYFGKRVK